MTVDRPADETTARNAAQFATTHWSTVLRAGDSACPTSQAALEKLCGQYWYPLYAFVRRHNFSPEDAEDLTQEFFAVLIEKGYLDRADRDRGRFRTFLLTSMQNFLRNARDRDTTWKRGGRQQFVSWDAAVLESRYQAECQTDLSPQEIFEKRWAATLLEHVLDRLRKEFEADGRGPLFERLKDQLWGDAAAPSYAEAAAELGMNATALRVAAHRLRRRFRETLRGAIAETVDDPGEIDDEIRHLLAVLGR
jgi:RNA polymerase sigma factor (sigma-70 family)